MKDSVALTQAPGAQATAHLRRKVSEARRKRSTQQLAVPTAPEIRPKDQLSVNKDDKTPSRRRWSQISINDRHTVVTPIGYYLSTNRGLQRFRGYVHSIIMWVRIYHYSSSQVRQLLRFFSNVDLGLFEKPESDDLMFSPHAYKANKQAMINLNSIEILKRDPGIRTESDLRPIMAGLRGYAAINDFPRDMIERIARRSWYQEFEPASVIVREGDNPMYYYFILSGKVLVSVIDRDKMVAKTVVTLTRGDAFGELAIVEKSRRKSSVIATEKTGLLILTDVDYKEIFMNGGIRFIEDPFFQKHICFRKFPLENFRMNPRNVLFSFFKAGTILVEDSKMSNWIFIVKSGSCRVIMPVKRLDLVEKEKIEADQQKNQLEAIRERESKKQELQDHETLLRRSYRRHMKDLARQNPLLRTSGGLSFGIEAAEENPNAVLDRIGREDTIVERPCPASRPTSRMPQLKPATLKRIAHQPSLKSVEEEEVLPEKKMKDKKVKAVKLSFWSDKETVQGRRTLATDLNRDYYFKRQKDVLLERLNPPEEKQMITIQRLTSGMIFGLIDKFFENQPSMKLVSDGCECFVIRKDIYLEHADDELLNAVANTLRPYPSETDVIDRKLEHIEWKKHSQEIFRGTLEALSFEHVNVHDSKQAWPVFPKLPPIR